MGLLEEFEGFLLEGLVLFFEVNLCCLLFSFCFLIIRDLGGCGVVLVRFVGLYFNDDVYKVLVLVW